jgi:hypothetical protein
VQCTLLVTRTGSIGIGNGLVDLSEPMLQLYVILEYDQEATLAPDQLGIGTEDL